MPSEPGLCHWHTAQGDCPDKRHGGDSARRGLGSDSESTRTVATCDTTSREEMQPPAWGSSFNDGTAQTAAAAARDPLKGHGRRFAPIAPSLRLPVARHQQQRNKKDGTPNAGAAAAAALLTGSSLPAPRRRTPPGLGCKFKLPALPVTGAFPAPYQLAGGWAIWSHRDCQHQWQRP
jgi:hypothetical protein